MKDLAETVQSDERQDNRGKTILVDLGVMNKPIKDQDK